MLNLDGIERYLTSNILQLNSMNYATGYAFNTRDIFENFPLEKMKLSPSECRNILGYLNKRLLAIRIFIYAVKIILLDIIENNVTFKFPTKRECYLNIVGTFGEDFKQARRNGKWIDVDYLKSDFTGYQMQFMYIANGREIKKPVYLSKWMKDKITKNTNEGMQYY